ncbi:MAG: sulfatase-like hydrolase/transferase [Hyphomonadaceae bacterium]
MDVLARFSRALAGLIPLTLLSACVSAGAAEEAQTRSPNIVLIVADDLGYGDLGAYGGLRIHTPNIDALAADGVRFTNGYVTAAVCAPSRAGLLSGRHQQNFGYEFNPVRRDLEGVGIPANVRILPEVMHERGYRTALIGKWHLGRTRETHPMSRGFDEFVGFSPGATGYLVAPGPGDEWLPDPVPGLPPGFLPMRLERGYEREQREGGYLTDILTDEAVEFIGRNRERPFLLTLTYSAPHTPLQAPASYLQRYAHIENQSERIYAAMVSALDDGVGRVIAALRDQGLSDHTLVVFMSDNGCPAYIGEGVCSNGPWRGHKAMYLEGGVRVPMIVSWPGVVPRGAVYEAPVLSYDLTATILEAAGASAEGLDGLDLLSRLRTGAAPAHQAPIFWRTAPNYAVRDGDWKLIVSERADGEGMLTYLYDLEGDPSEEHNLASAYPEVVARLNGAFQEWNRGLPLPAFESERVVTQPLAPGDPAVNLYN